MNRKKQILRSYKKVIGTLFKNMLPLHLEYLARQVENLRETLSMWAGLNDDVIRVMPTVPPSSVAQTNVGKRKPRKSRRWYTDSDIANLLAHYTETTPNVYYTAAMQGDGRFGKDELAGNISGFIRNLRLAVNDRSHANKILIPINLGASDRSPRKSGNHWALTYIRVRGNQVETIFYMDSLGKDIPNTLCIALLQALSGIFDNSTIPNLERMNVTVQTDGYNCGPWVVEAARLIANNDDDFVESLEAIDNIDGVRAAHTPILRRMNQQRRDNGGDSQRSQKRQCSNRATISSSSDQGLTQSTSQLSSSSSSSQDLTQATSRHSLLALRPYGSGGPSAESNDNNGMETEESYEQKF